MALPDFDMSWSKVLPHDFGVWIECGTQCDEVYVHTAVLKLDETVDRSTSSYLDDIFVNEVVVSVQFVEYHLLRYGLECKPAERVFDGATVLGLAVWGSDESYVGSATTHSARFRTR